MDHPISRAEPIRTRPLPERGQGLLPNPGVRTPTEGLLIDLGFDPPSVTTLTYRTASYDRIVSYAYIFLLTRIFTSRSRSILGAKVDMVCLLFGVVL